MSAAVRAEEWTDAVFQAVAVLRARMADSDAGTTLEAARLILQLETTRMRHGRSITGTREPFDDLQPLGDGPGGAAPAAEEEMSPDELRRALLAESVRRGLLPASVLA